MSDSSQQESIRAEYARTRFRQRGSLQQMVDELDRQRATKVDFVADQRMLTVCAKLDDKQRGCGLVLLPKGGQEREWVQPEGAPIKLPAMRQLCHRVEPGVPAQFWDKLLAERPYRAEALLTGLMTDTGKRNLIRCLDGQVRAVLSNHYKVVDHLDMAVTALETAREFNGEVLEGSLSDTHMRLKMISRDLWDSIEARRSEGGNWYVGGLGSQEYLGRVAAKSEGDMPGGPGTIWPCVTVSNSETGHGGIHLRLGVLAGICFNLATVEDVISEIHLGGAMAAGVYSDETRTLEAKTIAAKLQDAIRAAFTPATWRRIVGQVKGAAAIPIEAPGAAVDNLVTLGKLTEVKRDAVLEHFLTDYRRDCYGLSQAIARTAQDEVDPDAAHDLEWLAGEMIRKPETAGQAVTAEEALASVAI